jgi:hypothetical protein
MQSPLEQTIDGERERWTSNLTIAIRTLRKPGFSVVQDPLASQHREDVQVRQSHEAACVLVGFAWRPDRGLAALPIEVPRSQAAQFMTRLGISDRVGVVSK